jgi:predicted nucleic acid-binding protein
VTPKGYLLDTNVISELLRKRPDAGVVRRLHAAPAARLKVSVMSVVELKAGTARVARGDELWRRVRDEVLVRVEVLALGEAEAEVAGEFLAMLQVAGQPIGVPDALIAATAAVHELVVVTRNVRHLARLPVAVESWWT